MKRWLMMILAIALCGTARAEEPAKLIEAKKIWSQAPHNAFTDLVRWKGNWYCVFREGKGHVSPDGALRVITSPDGDKWESAALITSPNSDLRDAKLTIMPDGNLMLAGAEALHDKSKQTHQSLAWFSSDGRNWSEKHAIGDPNFWLWRVTWHKGEALGIGYACGAERSLRLYSSKDGKKFETVVPRLYDVGYPNETSIVFEGDTAYCLLRRDGKPAENGLLGISQPPYKEWEWKDLGQRIGGPHMIRLPDGRFVAAVRMFDDKTHTALCWVDPKTAKLTKILKLPSGGDTSYAGMVYENGLLWVSYYSSHEGKTNIYLAKVELPAKSPNSVSVVSPIENVVFTNALAANAAGGDVSVRDIGSQRELFVDNHLIAEMKGAKLHPYTPVPQDVVFVCDAPWEGNTSAYYLIFADGDRYRMYYRGSHYDEAKKESAHPEVACYAESRDGIHWEKPKLGIWEFNGSKDNNIVWIGPESHTFAVFKDTNPKCAAEARYKALGRRGKGLTAFKSPDGVHWSLISEKPVITNGAFDSQNLAFWDEAKKEYRAYWRYFIKGDPNAKPPAPKSVRAIRTATSQDFINWENEADLAYGDAPLEHLYTNAVQKYPRAPHLFVGFPTRFQPKNNQVEPVLMTSRDGVNFKRWPEPLVPITAPKDRDGNRSNYMTAGLLQLPNQDREISVFATEAYYTGPASRVRRFTFRTDGFVSLQAGQETAEVVTQPLKFAGKNLELNYQVKKSGKLQIEIQDVSGKAIPGFSLSDCPAITGDEIGATVKWTGGSDVSKLAGTPVRLKFVMKDADLYSLKFNP